VKKSKLGGAAAEVVGGLWVRAGKQQKRVRKQMDAVDNKVQLTVTLKNGEALQRLFDLLSASADMTKYPPDSFHYRTAKAHVLKEMENLSWIRSMLRID